MVARPPAILAAYWIAVLFLQRGPDTGALPRRLGRVAIVATMALLLGLFALRQIPLTLSVLGFER